MTSDLLPAFIRDRYEVREWRHACAILNEDFPGEWKDIIKVLTKFRLHKSHLIVGGGGRSLVSRALDSAFYKRGWKEHGFDTSVVVDGVEMASPTGSVLS